MKVIIGSGLYGLYAAKYLSDCSDDRIVVLEYDDESFKRATFINQARVHMGYHYPRSISTAQKSASYFDRFVKDYGFAILTDFDQIYATSADYSWTNGNAFIEFCRNAGIVCERIDVEKYFNKGLCDGAFLTREYTYDAKILRDYFLKTLSLKKNVQIEYNVRILHINKEDGLFKIHTNIGTFVAEFVLNASYASTNQVAHLFGYNGFEIKYELCEIILCEVSDKLRSTGITVMDGPFFSIMPFGKTGLHSLTSVTFTPHITSYSSLPEYDCQKNAGEYCSSLQLGNCNDCKYKPKSAWPYMSTLARKYLKSEFDFKYIKSLYSVKPILLASEVDDSRPTVIKKNDSEPLFYSVLSGKINTIYDMDNILNEVLM